MCEGEGEDGDAMDDDDAADDEEDDEEDKEDEEESGGGRSLGWDREGGKEARDEDDESDRASDLRDEPWRSPLSPLSPPMLLLLLPLPVAVLPTGDSRYWSMFWKWRA